MTNFTLKDRIAHKAKTSVSVALMRYLKLRAKLPQEEIAIVEGSEDAVFYSTVFCRIGNASVKHYFIANGKDNVLGIRDLIKKSKDIPRGGGLIFLVDYDFDGLKFHSNGDEVYVTPTYAIENILVCKEAFVRILLSEFKMSDADHIEDVKRATAAFDALLSQHQNALEEANQLIHHVRTKSLKGEILTSGSISDQCQKFADFDLNTRQVVKLASGVDLEKLISLTNQVPLDEIRKSHAEFEKIDPAKNWRGKFLFFLYRRFLGFLIEDRNKKTPSFFTKGNGKVSMSVTTDSIIRTLASVCTIPPCMNSFINEIPKRKLV